MTARAATRHVAQPRGERRGVEQVPRVEQAGQEHDARPRQPARDVADRGELGGPGERRSMLIAIASIGEKPASRAASP